MAPAIDMVHLGSYTQGDRAMELELLTLFMTSAQEYIDTMAASEGEAWWTAAHSLKGVALGVGAGEIATLAEAGEAYRDSEPSVRHDHVAAMRAALQRVRCFVADLT
ncbi:MAG: Hpt domain-containing protein [Alphaproteobacteria bacterium]|jgi:hypothetical protein|nr:Hpt domain-containing protein [Alphaproteobacteria bacterium]